MPPLTEEQRAQAALQFILLDQDSDGFIASNELGFYLRAVGLFPTAAEVTSYLPLVDAQHQGKIAQADALELVERLYPQRTQPEELHAALKVLDEDADGYLTTAQLRLILTTLGTRLTTEEADEVLQDVEKDADGMVSIDDIAQLLLPPTKAG